MLKICVEYNPYLGFSGENYEVNHNLFYNLSTNDMTKLSTKEIIEILDLAPIPVCFPE